MWGSSSHRPSSVCPASSPPSIERRMPITSSGDDRGSRRRSAPRSARGRPQCRRQRAGCWRGRGTARADSRARHAARSPETRPGAALTAQTRKPSMTSSISPSVSARARVGSRGERTADGATGANHISAPVVSRPRCTSWHAATAPSERIASARSAIPGRASSRQASVTIRRRHVDSGAVTVPPTISIAAPPAARRRQ